MWCMGAAYACETEIQTVCLCSSGIFSCTLPSRTSFSTPDSTRDSGCGSPSARRCHPCVVVGVAKKERTSRLRLAVWARITPPNPFGKPAAVDNARLAFFLQTHVLPSVSREVRRRSQYCSPPLARGSGSVSFQTQGLSKQSRLACLWAGMPLGHVKRLDSDGLSIALCMGKAQLGCTSSSAHHVGSDRDVTSPKAAAM